MGDRKDLDQPGSDEPPVRGRGSPPALAPCPHCMGTGRLSLGVGDTVRIPSYWGTFTILAIHGLYAWIERQDGIIDTQPLSSLFRVGGGVDAARTEQVSPPIRESISLDQKEGC